jgi:hypothetical protein
MSNGRYKLVYLKYIEDVNDSIGVIKEWYPTEIITSTVDHRTRQVIDYQVEPNPFNDIPAICSYNQKSPVRGIGISDISDIAMAQKTIYNLTSEVESSIRINGHPTLVKTAGSEASAGAGSVIQIEDNLDPGLKPYMLAVSTDINSIYTAIEHTTAVIDKMANTGSIRATESRRMSGVAQQQEFELLNAKLSEKADNLQLTEESIWQWYAYYQGLNWSGKIDYPDSFAISDTSQEIQQLQMAKNTATDPRVLAKIDLHILEFLGHEDAEAILGEVETVSTEQLEHPSLATLSQSERLAHIQTMLMEGYSNAEILALHPELVLQDIIDAGAAAARNNN